MSMRLTEEQEQLVLNNQRLVHYYLKRYHISVSSNEYEDMFQMGLLGLTKAALTFDKSKGIKFGTYASKCINNEFFMHFRKEKRHKNDAFLEDVFNTNPDGSELKLSDILPSSEDIEEGLEKRELCTNVISIILNLLESRERLIMLYKIAGFNQESIAKFFKISRSYISRIEKKTSEKIKSYLSNTPHYMEVFSMVIVNDTYQISFSPNDIRDFNKVFESLSQKLPFVDDIHNFKINCNKDRVVIQVPAHPDSFSFIAQIIQEIDEL